MKKVLSTILMAVMLISFYGCCNTDHSKPSGASSWDVSKTYNWEIWAQGKLVSITKVIALKCTTGIGCRNHNSFYSYKFTDGKTISISYIRNPGTVLVGQTGVLYKYVRKNKIDRQAWFQWMPNEDIPIVPVKVVKEVKPVSDISNTIRIDIPNAISIKETTYSWKNYRKVAPIKYQIVLIRLENGLVTTGYLNNINDWKFEINRREPNGGPTILTVNVWKEVDLN